MENEKLIVSLVEAIDAAKGGKQDYINFYEDVQGDYGSNEMLFFLKPELTMIEKEFRSIATFVFEKIEEYGLNVTRGFVISGRRIEEANLIAEHYGIIDAASRSGSDVFSDSMWRAFEQTFGKHKENVRVYGSVEYLKDHNELDADDLSERWVKGGYTKIGSGVYCQHIEVEDVYLINGFYPQLLRRFTQPGSCIGCFLLRGHTSWGAARNQLVGATAPGKAVVGSIRNSLLERKKEFGLQEISANKNGVHLSAGPVEGVVEILRFSEQHTGLEDLVFGRMLQESFAAEQIEKILSNAFVKSGDGHISTFDLTEELDSGDAIERLKRVIEA
jgi:hypothetical protein